LGVKDHAGVIRKKYKILAPHLNERSRRLFAAVEASSIGYGGVSLVARVTKISRRAIHVGLNEISRKGNNPERVRAQGGGRKLATENNPHLLKELESLVEPLTRGDPMSAIRWTCKSTNVLSEELRKRGHKASPRLVASLLHKLKYSLQGNQKTQAGKQHPDRNSQFEYINAQAAKQMGSHNPVISVDTKKKELVGNYKNNGTKWRKKGRAPKVNDHDFPDPKVPRAHPYGIYDLAKNIGWVNVGTTHDTASFAVASIRGWWKSCGLKLYPKAKKLFITADAGGSNGSRLRLWKWELQRLADETGMPIKVSHFPPGTSKWNKIEHRLFSFISQNWKGEPLINYETIVQLIAATKTATGLRVTCKLDKRIYKPGKVVTKDQFKSIRLKKNKFHGDWNYEILPRKKL
jgi:transposase